MTVKRFSVNELPFLNNFVIEVENTKDNICIDYTENGKLGSVKNILVYGHNWLFNIYHFLWWNEPSYDDRTGLVAVFRIKKIHKKK